MRATVGVIVRNEAQHIGRLLASLAVLEFDDDFEVIIVDGHSTDQTPDIVTSFGEANPQINLRLLTETGEPSHGNARNNVLENARGDYIAFTDADCEVKADWLRSLVDVLESERTADHLIVAAGGIRYPIATDDWKEKTLNAMLSSKLGSGGSAGFVLRSNRFVDSIGNYNAIYVADVIKAEKYRPLRVGEDFDLNRRLIRNGYKIVISAEPKVFHHQAGSFREFLRQMFGYGKAQARVWRTTGELRWFAPAASLFLMGSLLGWMTFFISMPLFQVYVLALALYFIIATVASIKISLAACDRRVLMSVLLFPLQHWSYGAGFLWGLLSR